MSSLTLPLPVCCLKFGYQFRESIDHAHAQPLETLAVLVAVGGQHAVNAHRGRGFGVVSGIADINHILRAMGQVGQMVAGTFLLAAGVNIMAAAGLDEVAV